MKKLIIALCVLCPGLSYGQITLIKTLEGSVNYTNGYVLSAYGDVEYYCEAVSNDTWIDLYNTDLSLYKSVQLNLPDNSQAVSCLYFTKTLFNKDGKIEFLVIGDSHLYLCNEDGTLLQDLGGEASTATVHQLPGGEYRMVVPHVSFMDGQLSYTTDIYSLPGTFNTKVEQANQSSAFAAPYPNPASAVINLPYELKDGETAIMQIFDLQGKPVEEKRLDSMFDEIMLDVSAYVRGTYVYTVNGVSNRFVVQ